MDSDYTVCQTCINNKWKINNTISKTCPWRSACWIRSGKVSSVPYVPPWMYRLVVSQGCHFCNWTAQSSLFSSLFHSCSGMDIFPTLLSLADITPPADRHYDGTDATNILLKGEKSGHKVRIALLLVSNITSFKYSTWIVNLTFFVCSFSFTLTAALQGHLVTCKQFEWGGTKLST